MSYEYVWNFVDSYLDLKKWGAVVEWELFLESFDKHFYTFADSV